MADITIENGTGVFDSISAPSLCRGHIYEPNLEKRRKDKVCDDSAQNSILNIGQINPHNGQCVYAVVYDRIYLMNQSFCVIFKTSKY